LVWAINSEGYSASSGEQGVIDLGSMEAEDIDRVEEASGVAYPNIVGPKHLKSSFPLIPILSYGVFNGSVVLDGLEANPPAEELLCMLDTVEGAKQRARELIDQQDWR
jgi:hypothetical protein